MKKITLLILSACVVVIFLASCSSENTCRNRSKREFNAPYEAENLNRIAFPIGGMGAGMFCIEGVGAISNMSIRHQPNVFFEPCMFAAIHVKGIKNGSKVLEGPVPNRKKFGGPESALGGPLTTWGLPRFDNVKFTSRFPFATIQLSDEDIPLQVELKGWSPFIPTDNDNSSLPVGAIEYTFTNTSTDDVEAIFSYNSRNFMKVTDEAPNSVQYLQNGFILSQSALNGKEHLKGDFAIYTDEKDTKVNYCWFRGGWWDSLTMAWNAVADGTTIANEPVEKDAPGASLYVPFNVKAGQTRTIRLYMAWYVPQSDSRIGEDAVSDVDKVAECPLVKNMETPVYYKPWYSSKFKDINEVANYWLSKYDILKAQTELFTNAFYSSTLPPEVIEAVGANLSILKSPTVMRQHDGRLWNYEGCGDTWGSCHGSCTHVWNYAQAIPHLFPALERTLRETEFFVSQNKLGHQMFRTNIPIRPVKHDFHSASDGQLGGIIKIYRDWRIYGDTDWLRMMYPQVKQSLDYCINTWDPNKVGALEEPHHNTYDIEFWGPDGMCTSFYTSALQSFVLISKALNIDATEYENLLAKSKGYMENKLYDGEYFIQDIRWKDLKSPDPVAMSESNWNSDYSPEARAILEKEGPKYQYGKGCLSDGILGCWMALVAGMEEPIDKTKVKSHLESVYKYNLEKDLRNHANPQRPTYALGEEGGLLLCTWPKGGKLSLPFVYSDEVWTGIEYQVAAHLIFEGEIEKGLDIVRTCRERYDGSVRNPYNEYECGGWYARALASYSLLQALTGVRYDAVDKTLYIDSKVGNNFKTFLSTDKGFGTVELKAGIPTITMYYGDLKIDSCLVSGKETDFEVKSI